ncbi:MAG: hypothetical protein AAF921_00850 [Cyanobacteria bacterium P01_D01_bin.44]
MAGKKDRTQLQNLFKTGAKPSEGDFKDLIDSVLNVADDGLEKPSGTDTPLKIMAHGDSENVLDFYAKKTHTWRLNQKPTGASTSGLNFETGGVSKLFIDSAAGNVGLSITQPTAKLHIQQTGSAPALRIDDKAKDSTPLVVDADGKVGIGTDSPSAPLEIKATGGNAQQTNFLSFYNDGTGPTQESRIIWKNGSGGKPAAAIASQPGSQYKAGDLRFQTANNGTLQDRMIIDSSGNLAVNGGDVDLPGHVRLREYNSNVAYLQTRDDNSKQNISLQIRTQAGDGSSRTLTEAIRITHDGNVGIGTTDPGASKLKVAGDSAIAGTLSTDGDVKASGIIYAGGNPFGYENYEIYLRGSGLDSPEGNNTYLKIANVSIGMNSTRGLNTVILSPKGALKTKISHDVYDNPAEWNSWTTWVNEQAASGDIVAVASYDALKNAPSNGSAAALLRQIGALKAFQVGHHRSPYSLLFIKDRTGAMEVLQPHQGANAHIKTTYYQLLNHGNSAVIVGMIVMWSGAAADIPGGWALCNGQNGTPDLRDRFIMGAGSSNANTSGNPDTHSHSVSIPQKSFTTSNNGSHSHKFPDAWYNRTDSVRGGGAARKFNSIDRGGDNVDNSKTKADGDHTHTVSVALTATVGNSSGNNRPKWYALCFIMKL